jgi:hypothetical protein
MPAPGLSGQDAARVSHGQGPDPVLHRPADQGAGGLVLGLPDPAQVPGLTRRASR